MARGKSAYNRHVSAVFARLAPHGTAGARAAMREAASTWRSGKSHSSPQRSHSEPATNPGMGGLVKWGLIGLGVIVAAKAVAAAQAPPPKPDLSFNKAAFTGGTGLGTQGP